MYELRQNNGLTSEIGQLEKTIHTLLRLPRLMRDGYLTEQIDGMLAAPGLGAADRRTLLGLRDLLAARLGYAAREAARLAA